MTLACLDLHFWKHWVSEVKVRWIARTETTINMTLNCCVDSCFYFGCAFCHVTVIFKGLGLERVLQCFERIACTRHRLQKNKDMSCFLKTFWCFEAWGLILCYAVRSITRWSQKIQNAQRGRSLGVTNKQQPPTVFKTATMIHSRGKISPWEPNYFQKSCCKSWGLGFLREVIFSDFTVKSQLFLASPFSCSCCLLVTACIAEVGFWISYFILKYQ